MSRWEGWEEHLRGWARQVGGLAGAAAQDASNAHNGVDVLLLLLRFVTGVVSIPSPCSIPFPCSISSPCSSLPLPPPHPPVTWLHCRLFHALVSIHPLPFLPPLLLPLCLIAGSVPSLIASAFSWPHHHINLFPLLSTWPVSESLLLASPAQLPSVTCMLRAGIELHRSKGGRGIGKRMAGGQANASLWGS